jgi:GntR family transcriptional regulator
MNLLISMHSDIPIYEQIAEQIKKMVIHKELIAEKQLPSIRILAKEIQVGIITVKRAYDDLVSEGYLYSKQAKGYYVAAFDESIVKSEYIKRINRLMKAIKSLQEEAGIGNQEIEDLWKKMGRE